MILHSQTYRNHMNESITLTIRQYRSNGSHCKISIRREELGVRWFLTRLLLYFAIAQCGTIVFCWNKLQIRLLWTLCLLAVIALLLYIFSPAKEESLMLMDNLNGLEYEKQYLFGKCSSTFINTSQIIINEGITMQRVIFYLVAIPLCLQHLILDNTKKDSHTTTDDASKSRIVSEAKLIPLFMSTLPRLDCLKVIYSYIIKDQKQTQQQKMINSMDDTNLMSQFSRQILEDVLGSNDRGCCSEALPADVPQLPPPEWPRYFPTEGTRVVSTKREPGECDFTFSATITRANMNTS